MNIVFDLGGVLFRWKPEELAAQIFEDSDSRSRVITDFLEHEDWLEMDRGTMTAEEAILRGARRSGLPEAKLKEFLESAPYHLTPIEKTVSLLYKVKEKGYRLYVLSNMNSAFTKYLFKNYTIWDCFEGIVMSCHINYIKPEKEIYEYLLNTYKLSPSETLFIDDREENLSGAQKAGIQTLLFTDPAQCEAELKGAGVLDQ